MSSNTGATLTAEPAAPKVKKSVALSGVIAGNSAVCTVGRTGNDLHYRGYEIVELARQSTFEEVAYLLIHGDLPTESQLKDYKKKLKKLRGVPAQVKAVLEQIPAATHPMDVMRTACSYLGTVLPEKDDQNVQGARDIIDRLIASFGSMLHLLVALHPERPQDRRGNGRRNCSRPLPAPPAREEAFPAP